LAPASWGTAKCGVRGPLAFGKSRATSAGGSGLLSEKEGKICSESPVKQMIGYNKLPLLRATPNLPAYDQGALLKPTRASYCDIFMGSLGNS